MKAYQTEFRNKETGKVRGKMSGKNRGGNLQSKPMRHPALQNRSAHEHVICDFVFFCRYLICLLGSFRPFALFYSCTVVEGSSSCWSRGFIPAQITCSLKNWSWEHMLPGYRNTRESNMVGRVEMALKGKGAPNGEI